MAGISSSAVAALYGYLHALIAQILGSGTIADAVAMAAAVAVFAAFVEVVTSAFTYFFSWIERKTIARAQSRHGPTYVGKFGILQNLADLIKLVSKEAIVPDTADKPLFQTILPLLYTLFIISLAFIPLGNGIVGIDSSLGMLAVFVILSFSPLLLFLAGWTSGNKFGSISAQRSIVVLISYEAPMMLVVATVAMLASSFSFTSIVLAQKGAWFIALMPIGFFVFMITLLAELERPPFDLREADSELISGWLTDVSAPYYGLSLLLDYTRLFTGTVLVAIMFLGGWNGPAPVPPLAWFAAKVIALNLLIILLRVTTARMRIDKVLRLGWLYLAPLAVVNLLITFLVFVGW